MAKAFGGLAFGTGWILGISSAVLGLPWIFLLVPFLITVFGVFYGGIWRIIFGIGCATLFLGFFLVEIQFAWEEAGRVVEYDRLVEITGFISSNPVRGPETQRFRFRPDPPFAGDIMVFTRSAAPLEYGLNAVVSGTIRPPELRGDLPVIHSGDVVTVSGHRGSAVFRVLYGLRESNAAALRKLLPSDPAALISGLTLGTTEGMSTETLRAMRASGTTHLVALSGYNIAVLVLAISGLFRLFMSRRAVWLAVSGCVFLFMFMSGSEPSIVRAALMSFILLWPKELGGVYSFPHSIIFAGMLMLMFDPTLLRDPGFQLSFISLLGIAYGGERLGSLLPGRLPKWLSDPVSLTLAAQLAVLPVLFLNFGEVSLWSVPANLLVLPFVPWTMAAGFGLMAIQWFLPPLASALSPLIGLLLGYQLSVIRFFGAGEGATLRLSGSLPLFAAYYILLCLWWWRPRLNRNTLTT